MKKLDKFTSSMKANESAFEIEEGIEPKTKEAKDFPRTS
jgi:hypothetical protein